MLYKEINHIFLPVVKCKAQLNGEIEENWVLASQFVDEKNLGRKLF